MLRLLLAVALLCTAQARSSVTSQRQQRQPEEKLLHALGDATKALQAAQQSLEDAQRSPPSPALTSVSVVQDWSLVCTELCGAGLGLAPCAKNCAVSGLKAPKILNTDFGLAKCEQLHGSQSGTQCNGAESIKSYGDRLCTSYCSQRRRTLSGCSSCQLLDILNAASAGQSVTAHGSKDGKLKSLATSAQIQAMKADEPDWDEMCKSLCKTGDGGSLCNCDLSPFGH